MFPSEHFSSPQPGRTSGNSGSFWGHRSRSSVFSRSGMKGNSLLLGAPLIGNFYTATPAHF